MGTNYYFRPKSFTNIEKLNNNLNDSIKLLKEEYLKQLSSILLNFKSEYEDCSDLLHLTNISDLEDMVCFSIYGFEIPEIHICKISGGWIPLFEVNRCYSNFEEFEKFYNKHKYKLDLINEYNEVINFTKFKEDIFDRINNKNYQTHLQYNGTYGIRYYKDNLGVEWINSEFT